MEICKKKRLSFSQIKLETPQLRKNVTPNEKNFVKNSISQILAENNSFKYCLETRKIDAWAP
jgi:hypothetical protein